MAERFYWMLEHPPLQGAVLSGEPSYTDGTAGGEHRFDGGDTADVARALLEGIEAVHDEDMVIQPTRVTLVVGSGNERAQLSGEIQRAGLDGPLRLHFIDGSTASVPLPPSPESRGALDTGARLLEPITAGELTKIEGILGLLSGYLHEDDPDTDPEMRERIRAAIVLLTDTRNEAESNVTPRWRVVGAMRQAIRYVVIKGIGPAVGGSLVAILNEMGWYATAAELLQGLGA